MNLSQLFKIFGIAQTPEVAALIGDIEIDVATPASLAQPLTIRGQLHHLADGLAVAAAAFPQVPGLSAAHDALYTIFDFKLKAAGLRTEAVEALKGLVSSETTVEGATALASKWVEERTGIPAENFGPFLMALVRILVKLLLSAI